MNHAPMNPYTPRGAKVIYHGTDDAQVRWGGCDDPRPVLTEGATYTVVSTDVHSYHTKVHLLEVPGLMGFPSGAFHNVPAGT